MNKLAIAVALLTLGFFGSPITSPAAPAEAESAAVSDNAALAQNIEPSPAPAPAENKLVVLAKEKESPSFVVFVPEQIDTVWYWYYYTDEQQHIVQSRIEKGLLKAGYEVVDVEMADVFADDSTIDDIATPRGAVRKAAKLGATYAVVGKATASQISNNRAYGVNVIRSGAEMAVRVIRVSDGKIMAIEEASAQSGGQAQKAAAQGALKEAGDRISAKLCSTLNLMFSP